jgi:hypothetical protein
MPTFTPPPPLTVPQFTGDDALRPTGLAPGTIAISLFAIAILVFLISFALNRR